MPRPHVTMRKVREVLRLSLVNGMSERQIALATSLGRSTVQRYMGRASAEGLSWAEVERLDDHDLERRVLIKPGPRPGVDRALPDWVQVHQEMRRKGVTLLLLWMEYKERCPSGYQYSSFAKLYRLWTRTVDVVMRQEHRAGEKLFVDFAGQTLPIIDRETGEISQAEVFVAVLGASSYTYMEVTPSQELSHWVAAHVRAFEFFGGAPEILVPDNLGAGVTKAHLYEPDVNRTYEELAAHYGCAVIPARVRKPRDKAKVEVGVQVAERRVLAKLRNRRLFSISEANAAVRDHLTLLNSQQFTKLPGSRQGMFEQLDRPALRPLPERRYEYGTWKTCKLSIDYHVQLAGHYYSAPYQLVGQKCDVRVTAQTVEIYCRGRRVASHLRSDRAGGFTTDAAHMPESHREHLQWTPERLVRWSSEIGPAAAEVIGEILSSRAHPQQGFRSCLGILRLSRTYGSERLESACGRALAIRSLTYRGIHSILKTGRDRQPLLTPAEVAPPRKHGNVRGAKYYR